MARAVSNAKQSTIRVDSLFRKVITMQIQVHTDNTIAGSAELNHSVETEMDAALSRFGSQLTRVEVHLSDVNGPKTAGEDKRCLLEARLAGRPPMVVNHDAATLKEAIAGAAEKMERSLDSLLGRLKERKGRTPYSGEETP
jgi:hypothetical protein